MNCTCRYDTVPCDTGRRGGEEIADGKIIRMKFAHDLTTIEHEGAVAHFRDLLEVG